MAADNETKATLTIGDKTYELDNLTQEQLNLVRLAKFAENEITRLEAELHIHKTAHANYIGALKAVLEKQDA